MKKCKELADVLLDEYNDQTKTKKWPLLDLHLTKKIQENYTSSCSAGIIKIEADGLLSQAFAISQMMAAVQAGHVSDFVGNVRPRFDLRPLWLGSQKAISVTEEIHLAVPEFMVAEDAEFIIPRFCRRIIENGYNSIIFGAWDEGTSFKTSAHGNLKKIFTIIQEHGIKIIAKPHYSFISVNRCPYDTIFRQKIQNSIEQFLQAFPEISYFFWESLCLSPQFRHHNKAEEATEAEIVLEEVKFLETCVKNKADSIFYIPTKDLETSRRQAEWMISLMDDMGKNTILAFSAVAGDFSKTDCMDHYFWKKLRTVQDISSTRLLPIINAGLLELGEGLWPIINIDSIEKYVSLCRRHNFAGLVAVTKHIPSKGSLLDCNLWVTGQILWRDISAGLLLETWFNANRPGEDLGNFLKGMKIASEIAKEMQQIRVLLLEKTTKMNSDEFRGYADNILFQLKKIKRLLELQRFDIAGTKVKEYYHCFIADVRCFVDIFLQECHIPSFPFFQGEEVKGSFWLNKEATEGRLGLLYEPQQGLPGSEMEAIYMENRWL